MALRWSFSFFWLLFAAATAFCQKADSTERVLPVVPVVGERGPGLRVAAFDSGWQADSLGRFPFAVDDAAALLARLPGAYLRDYGGHGGMRTVSLRGLAANTTQLQFDGVWVPELQSGVFDLNGWLLDGAAGVSLSNQAAQAAGGTSGAWVNFRSRMPRRSVSIGAGSFGERSLGFSDGRTARNWSAGGQYRFLTADDNFPFDWNEERGKRLNADYALHQFTLDLRNNNLAGGKLTYRAAGFLREQGIPGPVVKGNAGNETERLRQPHLFQYLKFEKAAAKDLYLSLAASHRWNRMELAGGLQESEYDLHSWGFQAAGGKCARNWNAELSLRANRTQLEGNRLGVAYRPISSVSRKEAHAAAALGLHTKADSSGVLSRSARLTASGSFAQGFAPEGQFALQAEQRILSGLPLFAFIEAGRGIRYPSFNELYYFAFGNSGLDVERVWSAQAGLRIQDHTGVKFAAKLGAFANRTENKIISIPISPVRWTTYSLGRTEAQGLEAALYLFPCKGCLVFANGTALQARDFSLSAGALLPYAPQLLAQGGAEFEWRGWRAGASVHFTGERYSSLANEEFYRLTTFTLLDLNLGRELRAGDAVLSLEGGLRNLLDANYALIQSFPMPGRTFWLRFSWNPISKD